MLEYLNKRRQPVTRSLPAHANSGRAPLAGFLAAVLFLSATIAVVLAGPLTVSPDTAAALQVNSIADFAALSGIDPARVRALFVRADTGWVSHSRSGLDYAVSLAAGADAVRGGPLGGRMFARDYDGVSDLDHATAHEDSLDWVAGTMVTVLFRGDPAGSGSIHYFLSDDSDRLYPMQSGTPLRYANSGGSWISVDGPSAYDGAWHLLRLYVSADTVIMAVDATADTAAAAWTPDGGGGNTRIAGFASNRWPGQVALVAYCDFPDRFPTAGEFNGLSNRISPHLDNTQPFAGAQAALDYARAELNQNGRIDTVALAPGKYHQPLVVETDSLALTGTSIFPWRTTIDLGPLPAYSAITLDSATAVTVENLTLRYGNRGVEIADTSASAVVRRVTATGQADAGVLIDVDTATSDTITVTRCTLDSAAYGARTSASNKAVALVSHSLVTRATTEGITVAGGAVANSYNLFWNNTSDYSGAVLNSNLLAGVNPLYYSLVANDGRVRPTSPAINAGNPATSPDPDNSTPDLGACWFTRLDQLTTFGATPWANPAWSRPGLLGELP
ncbi:MAG: hypothetical protein MAG453_00798 [Calditrichaeota bacterium]|nr:hypothetical protein [Calditrichota bacterium]